jgi:hypothetical protein
MTIHSALGDFPHMWVTELMVVQCSKILDLGEETYQISYYKNFSLKRHEQMAHSREHASQ